MDTQTVKNNRALTFVRVDVDKTLREKKTLPKDKFLKETEYSRAVLNGKNWQIEMGKKGLMLKEDYEKGLFAAYGLSKERVTGHTAVKELESANTDLQKRIAELEAELAKKQPKKEKTTNE